MRNFGHDPLLAELATLVTDAPAGLVDRVAAHWVRVPASIGELFVAFTDHGIGSGWTRTISRLRSGNGSAARCCMRTGRPQASARAAVG